MTPSRPRPEPSLDDPGPPASDDRVAPAPDDAGDGSWRALPVLAAA